MAFGVPDNHALSTIQGVSLNVTNLFRRDVLISLTTSSDGGDRRVVCVLSSRLKLSKWQFLLLYRVQLHISQVDYRTFFFPFFDR